MTETLTGGCQCGRVRYRITLEKREGYLCHCRMCQRATGGFAAAFVNVPVENFQWLAEPEWHESSPIARRPFCRECGTPLGFRFNDAVTQDVTYGSLDDPSGFVPVMHFGSEAMHEEWLDTSGLERRYTAQTESVAKRWKAAGLDVPQ